MPAATASFGQPPEKNICGSLDDFDSFGGSNTCSTSCWDSELQCGRCRSKPGAKAVLAVGEEIRATRPRCSRRDPLSSPLEPVPVEAPAKDLIGLPEAG